MPDYYCNNCEWEGNKLVETEDGDMVCPECESGDWEDYNAVGPDDYISQNPREMPRE